MTTIYLILTAAVGVVAAFFGGTMAGKKQGLLQARYRAADRDLKAGKAAKDAKEGLKDATDADLVDRLSK
jgi:hypothetical protein